MKLRKSIKQMGCSVGLSCGALLGFSCAPPKAFPLATTKQRISQTLIIYYDSSIGAEPLLKAVKNYPATLLYEYKHLSGIVISLPAGKDVEQAQQDFAKVKGVLGVQKNEIIRLH